MNPFRRRKRTRRDMVVLGGWLFADLLLGLAMLFLVANTVGSPPPTPTPRPTPNQLATAEASFAAERSSLQATEEALQSDIALAEQSARQIAQADQEANAAESLAATQTAQAEATEAVLSDAQLATREAQATEDALAAQATIAAFATEAADADLTEAEAQSQLATISAEATAIAAQIDLQATEQAEIAAVATQNADSGANAHATVAALEASIAENAQSQTDSQSTLATSEAAVAAANAERDAIAATATAFIASAPSGSMSPTSVDETVQVDLFGVLNGDGGAISAAEQSIRETFQPYVDAGDCHAGFVLLSGRAPDIGQGNQVADAVFEIMVDTVPEVFGETEDYAQSANETVALPNTQPNGEVVMRVFFYAECSLLDGGGE